MNALFGSNARCLLTRCVCLAAASLIPDGVLAQACDSTCKHSEKTCLCLAEPSSSVRLVRFGSVERVSPTTNTVLNIGDQLISEDDDDAIVSLNCPAGSTVRLHGRFLAFVQPKAEQLDCAFNLLAGSSDVISLKPTEVRAGEAVMGSRSTRYSLRIQIVRGAARIEGLVFQGIAVLDDRMLEQGSKAILHPGASQPRVAALSPQDRESTAALYARIDATRFRASGLRVSADAQSKLRELYLKVLQDPDDLRANLGLAGVHAGANDVQQARFYVSRVEAIRPSEPADVRDLSIAKWQLYRDTNEVGAANLELQKIRRLDESAYQRLRSGERRALQPPLEGEWR
jgi:hypothetical protein